MHRFVTLAVSMTVVLPGAAHPQAPQSADMWRVVAATLATPAALQTGPTGAFWNPAPARASGTIHVGIEALQTSDALGLSGLLAGAYKNVANTAVVGLSVGRVEVGDLVRTAESPLTELGSIPVYEQLAGAFVGFHFASVSVGGMIRVHEARFDAMRTTGATLDAGVRLAASSRVTLAGATHFVPITLGSDDVTDYYGAVEFLTADVTLWGNAAALISRYGASYRSPDGLEHMLGLGLSIGQVLTLDIAQTREIAFGGSAWRPAFQIGLALGNYSAVAARSIGLNGIGAMYRFALDVALP